MIRQFKPYPLLGRSTGRLYAAALLAASLTPSLPAIARSAVSTGTSSNYTVKLMSWAEIPFRTVVRQRNDFSCGSAALATLLSYQYGLPTLEEPVFRAMWAVGDQPTIKHSGFSMLDMKRYLDGIGYETEGFRLPFDKLRRMQRPGIVLLDLHGYKHFVVLKGIIDGTVLVGDPMLGLTRYAAVDFTSHWNGIFLMIVDDPAKLPPRYNIASEWAPWSRAPLGGGRSGESVGRLTDYLPPLYQVSPLALSQVGAAITP